MSVAGEPSNLPAGILKADEMAYRSRALAQSEPFTLLARRYLDAAMEKERVAQPGNFSIWANAAFTKGYCVRRVEEDDSGLELVVSPADAGADAGTVADGFADAVAAKTNEIAVALRSDDNSLHTHLIGNEDRLLDVLDQIIGSEVRARLDNASSPMSSRARAELEDYLTYWVVQGYALRAAELAAGAIRPA